MVSRKTTRKKADWEALQKFWCSMNTQGTEKKPGSGNFELHATAANLGQLVGSKKESRRVEVGLTAQGRPRKEKFPTHDVLTDQTFLGLVGEQELEEKKRISRGFTPPPPFEMLFTDTDGTLEHVTAVTSAEQVEAYLPTLPGYTPPQPPNPDMLGPGGVPIVLMRCTRPRLQAAHSFSTHPPF